MIPDQLKDQEAEDEAILRSLIMPEEDRRRRRYPPTIPGPMTFRWFRSANVVPLEA